MASDETPQDGLEARLGKFDARLDRLGERIERAGGMPNDRSTAVNRSGAVDSSTAAEQPPVTGRYVLFIPGPSGYELAEREGPVPVPGETIELREGAEYEIAKVGPSPLPGDGRPCAYLQLS